MLLHHLKTLESLSNNNSSSHNNNNSLKIKGEVFLMTFKLLHLAKVIQIKTMGLIVLATIIIMKATLKWLKALIQLSQITHNNSNNNHSNSNSNSKNHNSRMMTYWICFELHF